MPLLPRDDNKVPSTARGQCPIARTDWTINRQQRLKSYLVEYDFRYNEREALGVEDVERMAKAIPGIVGKRLTYRRTSRQTANA